MEEENNKKTLLIKKQKKALLISLAIFIFIVIMSFLSYRFLFFKKVTSWGATISGYIDINNIDDYNSEGYKKNYKCEVISSSLDGSLYFNDDEVPMIGYGDYSEEIIDSNVDIKIYSIKDDNQYFDIISGDDIESMNLKLLYTESSTVRKNAEENRAAYFDLGRKLDKGYYLVSYTIDGFCDNYYQIIQISNIEAYVANNERSILVWTMNPLTDKPIENVEVTKDFDTVKTNSNGIAELTENYNPGEDVTEFIKIKNGDDEIIVAVNNYTKDNYYNAYIYTDKPIYMTSDTIKIWGFVPTELFIDEIEDDFYINFNNKDYKVTLDEDGIFMLDIPFTDYSGEDEYSDEHIYLHYNDNGLAGVDITIVDYVKPEIEYKIETNKNNYYNNENIIATLSANYLTGESILNTKLYAHFNGNTYNCTTNSNGSCNVSIPLNNYKMDTYMYDDDDLIIEDKIVLTTEEEYRSTDYDGDIEDYIYTNALASSNISILNRDINLTIEKKMVDLDTYYYDVTVEKITIVNDQFVYTKTTKNVEVLVTEKVCKASAGKYTMYNPNNNNEEEYYLYSDSCDLIDTEKTEEVGTYNVTNGYKEFNDLNYLASFEKEKDYALVKNYILTFKIYDSNGNVISKDVEASYYRIDNYYLVDDISSDVFATFTPFVPITYSYSDNYSFFPILSFRNLDPVIGENTLHGITPKKYSIGDTLDFSVYSNDITEKTDGTKLIYTYKEKILDTYIDKDELTYTEDYFPGVNIGGAFYNNEDNNIYLVKRSYLDYEETDREVNISLSTDKEEYSPNEEVTLNIKVTDKDNNNVKTNVLISVVDEAIFMLKSDSADEIVSLYDNKYFPFYQFSTYLDLPFISGGAGCTGSGEDIAKVSDTIYFENIKTDENGEATVTFTLNDLETKFRITAISVNSDIYYGTDILKIISKN